MENGFIKSQLDAYEMYFNNLPEEEKRDKIRCYLEYFPFRFQQKILGRTSLILEAHYFLIRENVRESVGKIIFEKFVDELEKFYIENEHLGFGEIQKSVSHWLQRQSDKYNEKYLQDY